LHVICFQNVKKRGGMYIKEICKFIMYDSNVLYCVLLLHVVEYPVPFGGGVTHRTMLLKHTHTTEDVLAVMTSIKDKDL
jgi:hypothetical protein